MKRISLPADFSLRTVKNGLLANMSFLGQFLRSPASTGSVCPSSHYLVEELVNMALEDKKRSGLIVDLGTGSGVVSRELLERGVHPEHILAIDISNYGNEFFRRYCPGIKLRIGDARNLANIINTYYPGAQIRTIISSLPLRSLHTKSVYEIMRSIWMVLRSGGTLIQFTYALWQRSSLEQYGFLHMESQYVPFNLPPALVEKYVVGGVKGRHQDTENGSGKL